MTIARVAELYGLSPDTLRYYEKEGLIPPVNRNASGIRDYDEEDCKNVETVKCLRNAGMSIERIAEFIALPRNNAEGIEKKLALLVEQKDLLAAQIEQIQETMKNLDRKIEHFTGLLDTSESK